MKIGKGLLAGIAVSALILGGAFAVAVEDKKVEITDRGFLPDKLEVAVGQKVVWKNAGTLEHTVTARDRAAAPDQDEKKPIFDSGPIKPGASWERVFDKEGTYAYSCRMDPKMTGTVIVKPAR